MDQHQINQARIIAEAQFDIARIQNAKAQVMEALETSTSEGAICERDINASGETGGIGERSKPPREILRQLLRIDRYERSAILRRRRAMRAFLLLQTG